MQMFKRLFLLVAVLALAVVAQAETTTWENYFYTGDVVATSPEGDTSLYGLTCYVLYGDPVTFVQLWDLVQNGDCDRMMTSWELDPTHGYGPSDIDPYYKHNAESDGAPNYYLVIMQNAEDPATRRYFMSSTVSADHADEWGVIDMGNQLAETVNAGQWRDMPAPEPTSGLLIILGLAGLALRRKQA